MKFIDWVMEQRRTKKWHEISSELGVHPSYLGHIKNGHYAISKKFAARVEEVSGGLCKKEEIVFEEIDPEVWKRYDDEIERALQDKAVTDIVAATDISSGQLGSV